MKDNGTWQNLAFFPQLKIEVRNRKLRHRKKLLQMDHTSRN
jgi:hypothetical protein